VVEQPLTFLFLAFPHNKIRSLWLLNPLLHKQKLKMEKKLNRNDREHRCRQHYIAQKMNNDKNSKNQNPNLTKTINDEKQKDDMPLQQGLAPSMDIIIQPSTMIKLDDDEISKIDEVHDELNTFF
jgi:hypothetical protein